MTADFSYLAKYEPEGSKLIDCPLDDLVGDVTLQVLHAGKSNRPYKNALDKMNTKTGAIRRVLQGKESEGLGRLALSEFRKLFAKHVIKGWRGVVDTAGKVVEFTEENCLAFLDALPDWIFKKVMSFCAEQANFIDVPDVEAVQEQAKN